MLQRFYQSILILPFILVLSGCLATSSVRYDASLVNKLHQASLQTFTFFASIEDGTQPKYFLERKEQYFTLIGQYESLEILANSRPFYQKSSTGTAPRTAEDNQLPSVTALQHLCTTLTHMKNTDQQQGLTKTEVAVYKLQTRTYLDQIITFEQHLKPE